MTQHTERGTPETDAIRRTAKHPANEALENVVVTDLGIRNGGIYAEFEGGAAHMLAAHFAEQFESIGGANYFEMTLHPQKWKHEGENLVVTVRRENGKTPHQLRMEAEAELSRLRSTAGEGLPEGCPTEAVWSRQYGLLYGGSQERGIGAGYIPVEINTKGTRARLEELQGGKS